MYSFYFHSLAIGDKGISNHFHPFKDLFSAAGCFAICIWLSALTLVAAFRPTPNGMEMNSDRISLDCSSHQRWIYEVDFAQPVSESQPSQPFRFNQAKLRLICPRLPASHQISLLKQRELFSLTPKLIPITSLSSEIVCGLDRGKKYRGGGRNIVAGLLKEGAVREIGKWVWGGDVAASVVDLSVRRGLPVPEGFVVICWSICWRRARWAVLAARQ